jgi:hypothetical protein
MPINPFRLSEMSAPEAPKYPGPASFSGISQLGASIGQYRDETEVGRIMAGAVDPRTGALDLQRAASALAVTGRDPTHYLTALARDQALKQAQAHFEVTSKIQQQAADAAMLAANKGTAHYDADNNRWIVIPSDPSKNQIQVYPMVPERKPPPAPGASLPGGPSYAGDFNPEEAPPYRTAGPWMPPPQQPESLVTPAQAAQPAPVPKATVGRPEVQPRAAQAPLQLQPLGPQERAYVNEYGIPRLTPDIVDNLITLKQDPYKLPGDDKHKARVFELMTTLRKGWSPDDYAKQEGKVPVAEGEKLAEEGAKFTQFKSFIDRFDDRYTTGGPAGYLGFGTKAINLGESSPGALAKLKGMSEEDALKAVNYYKDYSILTNIVRHGQFGASLTASEQKAYDRANITPDLDPRVARANLATQTDIVRKAMLRRAEGLIANGVAPDKVEAYFGTTLEELRKPIPQPEISTAPGARTIVPVQNEAQAQQMIGYTNKAYQDGLISYEQAVEDLRRSNVQYPERMIRRK